MWWFRQEENLNALSHLCGAILSVFALVLMITKAMTYGFYNVVGVAIFGGALVSMYFTSTIYHYLSNPKIKRIFQTIDHLNIFILIAGTYTPIALIALNGLTGWVLFSTLWMIAVIGFIYKICFFGSGWFSSMLYIFMGWIALFFIYDIVASLSLETLMWIVLGGVFYTSGVVFYTLDTTIKFAHTVWHMFVILGSICHFIAIYFYISIIVIN